MKTNESNAGMMNPVERNESVYDMDKILAEHPFLKEFDPHQRRLLVDCAMVVRFEAGETIFREGDPANRFYVITKGKVAIESYAHDRGNRHVQTIEAGDVLGWSWLFPPYYWHFDARALEPTEAIFFYGTPLRQECEADHDFGYALLRRITAVMLQRLQATRRRLLETPCSGCKADSERTP